MAADHWHGPKSGRGPMRTPSRKMPKTQAPKGGWHCAALALGLVALPLATLWWPLVILVPALIVGISSIGWHRDRRMAEARKGESICQFARGFDCRNIDSWIIRAVYEEFSGSFPLRPTDRLTEDLRIDGDDLDFSAIHIPRHMGRRLDGYGRKPMYGKIETVGEGVMFFHLQPFVSEPHVRA